jgi:hypothetical protein
MSIYEKTTILIAALALVVSITALIIDFCTRKKLQELTDLEIEKLKAEKERGQKAILFGFIADDYL